MNSSSRRAFLQILGMGAAAGIAAGVSGSVGNGTAAFGRRGLHNPARQQ